MSRNNFRNEYLTVILSDIIQCVNENRAAAKSKSIDLSKYDVVDIEVPFSNKKLLDIYKKIFGSFREDYRAFLENIFSLLDTVEEIETIPSVTNRDEISYYKVSLKKKGLDESSFAKLSKVPLLDHIEDIVDLILLDDKKIDKEEWRTPTETEHLLLLALLHDIGKVLPLMQRYNISRNEMNHEKRSLVFVKMLAEGGDYGESINAQLKRVVVNLEKIAEGSSNATVKRFLEYDEKSRILEMEELLEKEKI